MSGTAWGEVFAGIACLIALGSLIVSFLLWRSAEHSSETSKQAAAASETSARATEAMARANEAMVELNRDLVRLTQDMAESARLSAMADVENLNQTKASFARNHSARLVLERGGAKAQLGSPTLVTVHVHNKGAVDAESITVTLNAESELGKVVSQHPFQAIRAGSYGSFRLRLPDDLNERGPASYLATVSNVDPMGEHSVRHRIVLEAKPND